MIAFLAVPGEGPLTGSDHTRSHARPSPSVVSPECVSDPAPECPGTPVAPKRATGARVSFAIAYLAILAALRLWGFDGPFVIAAMVEDLIVNCRPLRSLLARWADALLARFPLLRKVREILAYVARVETGRVLLHHGVRALVDALWAVWQALSRRAFAYGVNPW
jgi:hypothetical protein